MSKLRRTCENFKSALFRKKSLAINSESSLERCLKLFDLTCLSLGAIIGAGIFVFAGSSIRDKAGPGIVLSFLIAGVPTVISAMCFAEFGARVPRSGSTYDFVYVTLGEFWAALVGWFFISAPVFFGATVARTWAAYLDTMLNGWIANHTVEVVGSFHSPYLSSYPDFFAAALIIAFSVIVGAGAKFSTFFNNIFAVIKLLVIAFIICYGFSFANLKFWTSADYGGFLPFGFVGVMKAASTAFFAYSGFEIVCTAAEEARNPKRDIVWSIILSVFISASVYILMCTVLTLMVPYNEVAPISSFANAFEQRGATWAKYVVAVGVLSALTNILFITIFGIPRVVYAMASDGLLFRWLSVVNQRTKVPIRAIAIYAAFTIVAMLLFNLDTMVDFVSMGGIICYALVSASVIILRYRPGRDVQSSRAGHLKDKYSSFLGSFVGQFPPGKVVLTMVTSEIFIMVALSALLVHAPWTERKGALFYAIMVIVSLLALVLIIQQIIISLFQQDDGEKLSFMVPFVPILPTISMFINILTILYLRPIIWLQFSVYSLVGALIYLLYGMHHSIHRKMEPRVIREPGGDSQNEKI